MCGIAGFINPGGASTQDQLTDIIRGMADCLIHRGPDSDGYWFDNSVQIALGHRRLSIIDLKETGNQPMVSQSGRFVIVFNGEIYNFKSIASNLNNLGKSLRGSSDTEALLEFIEEIGVQKALQYAVGMFAFALWDRKEQTITLARDRIGEKPLYYALQNGRFYFASTPRAIKTHPSFQAHISREALGLFFRTNYIPAPYCIYQDIRKLQPGCLIMLKVDEISSAKWPVLQPYWKLSDCAELQRNEKRSFSDQEAVNQLEKLLLSTVEGQMISDVPLGAFLSGGIDSSLVVALMQKISSNPVKTFTIGFDDVAYDESIFASEVAKHLGTDHTERILREQDALDVIPKLPYIYDEPFADSSMIPTFLVSKLAREQVTVSLTGDGGDEVFCGYNRQVKLLEVFEKYGKMPSAIRKVTASALRALPTSLVDSVLRRKKSGVLADQVTKFANTIEADTIEDAYLMLTQFWNGSDNLVLNSEHGSTLLYERDKWLSGLPKEIELLWLESMTSLPDDMLVKVDRAAMAVSLEGRMPLLDHRIISYAWSLPTKFRIRNGKSKWILRELLYKYVPQNLIERPKSGFGVPIDKWLQGSLRDWAEPLLNPQKMKEQQFLNVDLVQKTWNEHLGGQEKWQGRLWGILMFQAWLDQEKMA